MKLRRKYAPAIAGLGALILIWYAVSATGLVNAYVLPPPGRVWRTFMKMAATGEIFTHVGISLGRVLRGFSIAFALAFLLAALRIFRPGCEPWYEYALQFFRNVPPIAMIRC